jgi:hypothetical protein
MTKHVEALKGCSVEAVFGRVAAPLSASTLQFFNA